MSVSWRYIIFYSLLEFQCMGELWLLSLVFFEWMFRSYLTFHYYEHCWLWFWRHEWFWYAFHLLSEQYSWSNFPEIKCQIQFKLAPPTLHRSCVILPLKWQYFLSLHLFCSLSDASFIIPLYPHLHLPSQNSSFSLCPVVVSCLIFNFQIIIPSYCLTCLCISLLILMIKFINLFPFYFSSPHPKFGII